jgi:predicted nucleic acid-binding protein
MLVLDANILVRAVLGRRVRSLLDQYAPHARFFAPDVAFADAREHLPAILSKRGIDAAAGLTVLDALTAIVECVEVETYAPFEPIARQRLRSRDEEDWPIVAAALALNCPIRTEDADFFGTGIGTWTTDRVELFLTEAQPR